MTVLDKEPESVTGILFGRSAGRPDRRCNTIGELNREAAELFADRVAVLGPAAVILPGASTQLT
jgi:hypothetical protein